MKSVMKHDFSQVPKAEIQRSSFDRSHGFKTTFDAGLLIPIFVDEVLPGDTFNLKMTAFARLATPLTPFMDNLFFDTFFFFVPNRLVWDNWEKFNGQQTDPGDSTDYLVPQCPAPTTTGWAVNTLADYMGIPIQKTGFNVCAFWFRAYNLIWNEWFRDQNMQDSVVVDKDDGPDAPADYVVLRRGKRHDYFTSCLPWPQKGPAVNIPLGVSAPVYGQDFVHDGVNPVTKYNLWQASTASTTGVDKIYFTTGTPNAYGGANLVNRDRMSLATKTQFAADVNSAPPYADLTNATAATINSLRQAFQIQRLYERDARGGTRYTEIIRAHFGVTSDDARLQRPEYLGGGSAPIQVNPVTQTSGTGASGTTTPQGNLAAIGTMQLHGNGFTKSFTEHGVIIGLCSVRADLNYQQGLNRMWSRRTRFDFFWPALAHLGEQAVLNQEIYLTGLNPGDDVVFGYQERYAEYRYKPSLITGEFRSDYASSLDIWHLAQDFAIAPTLGAAFITENPPIDRVIADPSDPQFLLDVYHQLKCARPMPTYSVPGLIDHF